MLQVLVLNKDQEHKRIITSLLSSQDSEQYQISFEENYKDNIFDNQYFDVILVNQNTTGVLGLGVVKRIAELQITTPVIFIMANNRLSVDDRAMKLGASDCIPFSELTASLLKRSIRHSVGRKNTEAKLSFLATHDQLTGCANRALFQEQVIRTIGFAKRRHSTFGVMIVDLDRFKSINDNYGHDIGDLLIQTISKRIRSAIRMTDTVGRLGGDEFSILLEDAKDTQELLNIANKIKQAITPPMNLRDHEVSITTSIGIAFFPECGIDAETLLKSADIALYKAKELGRNQNCIYSNDLDEEARLKVVLERDLRRALIKSEFEIFYQPQVDAKTNRFTGAEALLRWRHRTLGIISPDKFIPILEDTGMIIGVEQWVLKEVCKTAFHINNSSQTMGKNVKFSINISGAHFKLGDLANNVQAAVRESGVDPSCIELELTEDIMIEHVERNSQMLSELSEIGVTIALDDFGKGHSSLKYLKDFPVDILKIDKAFIDNIAKGVKERAIVSAMIDLSHKLSIKVVAEGVEHRQQAEILKTEECDFIQGFLFAKPKPFEEFSSYVSAQVQAKQRSFS
ncbi:MAG: EAL domain-containing protein [Kangiellaceae bacterium]